MSFFSEFKFKIVKKNDIRFRNRRCETGLKAHIWNHKDWSAKRAEQDTEYTGEDLFLTVYIIKCTRA